MSIELLESFTQIGGRWQDFVCVFLKSSEYGGLFPRRMIANRGDFENGQVYGHADLINHHKLCQNDRKLQAIAKLTSE